MINANELRIGNKLQKENGKIYTVSRLDGTKDILVQEERGLFTLNYNLYGIPLTPEILEKCGFDRQNGVMAWEKEGVVIAYETLANFFRYYPITNPIKYLHQLQNLYFALTGEELNYTP